MLWVVYIFLKQRYTQGYWLKQIFERQALQTEPASLREMLSQGWVCRKQSGWSHISLVSPEHSGAQSAHFLTAINPRL